jgi:uncharacterized protein YdbL (DUF1318 family)
MKRHRFLACSCSVLSLAIAILLGAASAAHADDALDALRKSGVVGERYDGLLVLRTGPTDAAAPALVESVNAKRRAIYEARAKKEGVDPREVGKVYALEITAKAPPGTWFLGEDGKWVQKK